MSAGRSDGVIDGFAAVMGALLGLAAALLALRVGAPPVGSVGAGVGAAALTYVLLGRAGRARRRLEQQPFPAAWRALLEREVAYYRALPPEERARFEREVAVFLGEQTITGARGAPLDDELRLLVAASAVMLVFGRPGFRFPAVRDIIVYPESFDPDEWEPKEDGEFDGQVLDQGPILLSAEALREGFAGDVPGGHVGLHEFAHLLDLEQGDSSGVPSIMPWKTVGPWIDVMRHEAERAASGKSLLDEYAATDEAEFFAVATEAFFERPRALRRRHPELYRLLVETYGQDPAAGPVTPRRPRGRTPA